MSSPAGAGPSEPKDGRDDRRRSLGKYVKRMSSVFRREKKNKAAPSSSTAIPTPADTPAAAVAVAAADDRTVKEEEAADAYGSHSLHFGRDAPIPISVYLYVCVYAYITHG